jgi:vacuolar-type H+-ATPase subunit I/STV1
MENLPRHPETPLHELRTEVEPITDLFSKVCNSEALKLSLALHHMLLIGVSHLSLSRFVGSIYITFSKNPTRPYHAAIR